MRIVAATNADLMATIDRGHFRRDLYYRLAGFTLEVPPLRHCRSDIAALVEHFLERFSRAPAHAGQTIVVSPIPGNPTGSGQRLLDAVAALNPSWGNRYTVKVEAGFYELGDNRLTMKEWVDLEGSGILSTLIQANGSSSIDEGTIIAAANSEIRDLKVFARNGDNNIAILDGGVGSRVVNVRAQAFGGTQCWGIRHLSTSTTAWPIVKRSDIYVNCSSYNSGITSKSGNRPTVIDTRIASLGASAEINNLGMWLDGGGMTYELRDVSITVGDGTTPGTGIKCANLIPGTNWLDIAEISINTNGGIGIYTEVPLSLKIRHSNIVGARIGIQFEDQVGPSYLQVHESLVGGSENTIKGIQFGGLSSVLVGASQLDGGPVSVPSAWVKCAAVYDENYDIFNGACP